MTTTDKKRGKLDKVWQHSFVWKHCISDAFAWQKIDYMHETPRAGIWMLAVTAVGYIPSSAKLYNTGVQKLHRILNFKNPHYMNLKVSFKIR